MAQRLFLVLLSWFVFVPADAATNSEARVTFSTYVEFDSESKPSQSKSLIVIDEQVGHMFGPMGRMSPVAAPKGQYDVKILKTEKLDGGYYRVHYTYSGIIIMGFEGSDRDYKMVLPIRPRTVYKASSVEKTDKVTFEVTSVNVCTDDHYNDESDFWYFWSPTFYEGCTLQEGIDYVVIPTRIYRFKDPKISYPEYERLVNKDGEIGISVFFGMDDPETNGKNPSRSRDITAANYKDLRANLINLGFVGKKWSQATTVNHINELSEGRAVYSKAPFIEEFTKEMSRAKIRVRLFFGATGIVEDSTPFHYLYREALENTAVMMYDGHSGLGGNLDVPEIEASHGFKIAFPKDRYQILFFNSCSSYAYYNVTYFAQKTTAKDKKGTKNLDIISAGLETEFEGGARANTVLVKSIVNWAKTGKKASFQNLEDKMDSGNLLSINGDEDNPKVP